MPNQNLSGPNQPLNQHPVPRNGRYHLSQDAMLLTGITESPADGSNAFLAVPPPPAGVRREIGTASVAVTVLPGSADLTAVSLLFVDGSGKRALLGNVAGVAAPGDTVRLFVQNGTPFHLLEGDGGIYVTVSSAGAALVSGYAQWQDVRNIERVSVVLEENVPVTLFEASVGNAVFLASLGEAEDQEAIVFNWDDAGATVLFEMTDGFDTVAIGSVVVAATLTPGVNGLSSSAAVDLPRVTIPTGWALRATMTSTPNGNGPIELYAGGSLTNLGTARQNQGGAY